MRIFKAGPERFFDAAEERAVDVLFEAILPAGDDGSPGASQVKASQFLSYMLALENPDYYELEGWRDQYRQALPALDAASAAANGGRRVADLSNDEATELLRRLAAGELDGFPAELDQKRFFATLRGHCIEGCFGDPRWGGNEGGAMWRWFGYTTPAQDDLDDPPPQQREVADGL